MTMHPLNIPSQAPFQQSVNPISALCYPIDTSSQHTLSTPRRCGGGDHQSLQGEVCGHKDSVCRRYARNHALYRILYLHSFRIHLYSLLYSQPTPSFFDTFYRLLLIPNTPVHPIHYDAPPPRPSALMNLATITMANSTTSGLGNLMDRMINDGIIPGNALTDGGHAHALVRPSLRSSMHRSIQPSTHLLTHPLTHHVT